MGPAAMMVWFGAPCEWRARAALHAHPAVSVFEFPARSKFKEKLFGMERREMFASARPVVLVPPNCSRSVSLENFLLEVALWMESLIDVEV